MSLLKDKIDSIEFEDEDPGMTHHVCWCDPDRSFCGLDMTGGEKDDSPDPVDCVVCATFARCPRCGREYDDD